ncbi:hypothetical protein LEP1GSC088_3309 [Leptospira interrogans str. L1207]|nr:hypothetical protein LEP1GSC088_3309 [Leptospira interrogans str. L1207]
MSLGGRLLSSRSALILRDYFTGLPCLHRSLSRYTKLMLK